MGLGAGGGGRGPMQAGVQPGPAGAEGGHQSLPLAAEGLSTNPGEFGRCR